jgi:hypothetical protein
MTLQEIFNITVFVYLVFSSNNLLNQYKKALSYGKDFKRLTNFILLLLAINIILLSFDLFLFLR